MRNSIFGIPKRAIAACILRTNLNTGSSTRLQRDHGITQDSACHLAHHTRGDWAEVEVLYGGQDRRRRQAHEKCGHVGTCRKTNPKRIMKRECRAGRLARWRSNIRSLSEYDRMKREHSCTMAHVASVVWLKLSPTGRGGTQSLRSYDQCRWLTLLLTGDNIELDLLRTVGKQLPYKVLKRAVCREENGI